MAKAKAKRATERQIAKVREAHATEFEENQLRAAPVVRRRVAGPQSRGGISTFIHELPVLSSAIGVVLLLLLLLAGNNVIKASHLGPYALPPDLCKWAQNPEGFTVSGDIVRKYSQAPKQCITATTPGSYIAAIDTKEGTIAIVLDQTDAPLTVNNFVFLATHRFYDGTTFHRVEPGFVIQGGDPNTADPKADPKTFGQGGPGYKFKDELPPSPSVYTLGAVAMANSGPNTNGSQFFICSGDDTQRLAANYSFFGRIQTTNIITINKIVVGDVMQKVHILYDPKGTPASASATPTK